ncbi:hypothetical protein ACL03H_15600 [Saccharopolyspora sp. MS10]|uniref:hypothetical protein n=1 Tax=Saccharopolyspora sp. MS10 TaxID=3385973 RepID=UPI0039A04BEB
MSKIKDWGSKIVDTFSESVKALPGIGHAISAAIQGKNPLWEGLKGAVAHLSRTTKTVLIVGISLALLLGPVMLVVLLLGALIAWIVTSVRTRQNKTSRGRTARGGTAQGAR